MRWKKARLAAVLQFQKYSSKGENKMKNLIRENKDKITPVYLHLELKDAYLTEDQKRMLKRYGESLSGETIGAIAA
jgi:hypothetical protein